MAGKITSDRGAEIQNMVQFQQRLPLTTSMRRTLELISEMDVSELTNLEVDLGLDAPVLFPAEVSAYQECAQRFASDVIAFAAGNKEFLVYLTRAPEATVYTAALCSGIEVHGLIELMLTRALAALAWDVEKQAYDRTFDVPGFRALYSDTDGDFAGADIDALRMTVNAKDGYCSVHQCPAATAQLAALGPYGADAYDDLRIADAEVL